MKIANAAGRAVLVLNDGIADIAEVSGGRFGPDPMSLYEDWTSFTEFAAGVTETTGPLDEAVLDNPVPNPSQVFAVGLNYRAHAAETGAAVPSVPATFTKFQTSLSGPFDDIPIHGDGVDWEVELVVVIGTRAEGVALDDAWDHIAGLTVGQDVSDRPLQFAAGAQFSLGKSRTGFGPMGPWVVTPDELPDPDDLGLRCSIDGEVVQDARTSDLIFDVPHLIVELSSVLVLRPGDVIFTGTPAGVGVARSPQRFLKSGELVESWIEGIGTIRNRCR